MSARRSAVLAAVAITALLGVGLTPSLALGATTTPSPTPTPGTSSSSGAAAADDTTDASSATAYPGDPEAESLLVAEEDRRLIEVRAVANAQALITQGVQGPYRLATGSTYTLVLTKRDAPYTLRDLHELAPSTFVRQPDGSYLLAESIIVDEGATLSLTDKTGLVLRMLSNASGFVSIVTLGGALTIAGTSAQPLSITSWDPQVGALDTDTSDGRAYVRVTGGHADLQYVNFQDLGFWSGMTGGVSLTGTQLPGATRSGVGQEDPSQITVNGQEILPVDGAPELDYDPDLSAYSYVSARIRNVSFDGDAFGLFVTNADGVDMRESTITHSLVDGLVLHREVTNSSIVNTTATDNARDGFSLTRATSGVIFNQLIATRNGRNGISLEGGALAEGPSATGTPVSVYGNNTVTDSTSSDNARYGIEIVGGTNLTVDSNELVGNAMGIVVDAAATSVVVKRNLVRDSLQQGIALREAGTDALVENNDISGGQIGIYARNAGGSFQHNTISDVSLRGITLVGETGASVIESNSISGSGPSPIDTARTSGFTVQNNDTAQWTSTKSLWSWLRSALQPLTIMWLVLALIVIITAITSIGARMRRIRHPYPDHAPLTSYTMGVVTREQADALRTSGLAGAGAGR